MVPVLSFILLSAFNGIHGLTTVSLTPAAPSYSIHGDDFKQLSGLHVKMDNCPGCSMTLSVGVHYVNEAENQFPLRVDKNNKLNVNKTSIEGVTGPFKYQLYSYMGLANGTLLEMKPGMSVSRFAMNVVLSIVVADIIRPFGIHDMKSDTLNQGFNSGSGNVNSTHYSIVMAPQGKHLYSPYFKYPYLYWSCRLEVHAGEVPIDDQNLILSMPEVNRYTVNQLWRMSKITLKLYIGPCWISSTHRIATPNDVEDHAKHTPPFYFAENSLDYPASSKLGVERTRLYTVTDLPGHPNVKLTLSVGHLEGGVLELWLTKQDSVTLVMSTEYVQLTELGPDLICYRGADEFRMKWTPNPDSRNSSFWFLARAWATNSWAPPCANLGTQKIYRIVKPKNMILIACLPTFALVFMLELCLLGLYIQRAWRQFAKNKRQLDGYVTKQWEIEPAFLVIKQKIGRGAFANVHHGTYYGPLPCILTNTDLQDRFPVDRKDVEVAVKRPAENDDAKDFLDEIALMKTIGYQENLLSLLGCHENEKAPLLLTEFCALGSLYANLLEMRLAEKSGNIRDLARCELALPDFPRIAKEVASALKFLADHKLIHRDVASRNVLLTKDKISKLSDFGLSRQSDLFSSHAGHIPIKWSAPEAIEFGIFSQQSDVWSFGVLIWEMYSLGDSPYEDVEPKLMLESLKRGYRLDPPAETPDALRLLMISCWENRVSNRPSLSTIVATLHAYVHGDSANCGL